MFVGIDFGTSKSIVAVVKDKKPHIIPDLRGNLVTPSLVMVAPDRRLFIGHNALSHPARYQSKHFTISSIKRLMGKKGETTWGDFRTFPQEVSALILGYLKIQAEAICGEEITGAVLAVPAHFNINQRWATMQAAEAAGLRVLRMVNEATAAIMGYRNPLVGGRQVSGNEEGSALIFDFGAGTLDASVVEFGQGLYNVKSTAGTNVGGDDFDALLSAHILNGIKRDFGHSGRLDPMQRLVLTEAVKKAKIELSSVKETHIILPGFIEQGTSHADLNVRLDRETLETVCKDLFDRASFVLRWVVQDSGIAPSDLSDLLLVGGTSKMPYICEMVSQFTGLQPAVGVDPNFAVATGAAILAGMLAGDQFGRDLLLLDAAGTSYSTGIGNDSVEPMISRYTTLPTKKSLVFTTAEDGQKEVTISVFEGVRETQHENTLIGQVRLSGLSPAPKGVPQIEVTFDVDASGNLFVKAKDLATGSEVRSATEAPYRLNAAQMKVLRRKVESALRSVRQGAISVKEEQTQRKAQALFQEIEEFLASYQLVISAEEWSLLQSGNKLLREYCRRNAQGDDLRTLISSVTWSYRETLAAIVARSIEKIVSTSEFAEWTTRAADKWRPRVSLYQLLDDFDREFNNEVALIGKIITHKHSVAEASSLKKLLARMSESQTICLALILARRKGVFLNAANLPLARTGDQLLLTIFLLYELGESNSLATKQAAAQALCALHSGADCLFLLEVL